MNFIDLFSGLGGFHIGLSRLNAKCVFASEKKESLARLYESNFNIPVNRDITKVDVDKIPSHDILCAGFPCQPFSKAGSQNGLKDKNNGYLFDILAQIIAKHKPSYFLLENVRNLETHDQGETWNYIFNKLQNELGYSIRSKVLSPHNFGIPQHRERFFILGSLKSDLEEYTWPKEKSKIKSISEFLITDVNPELKLETHKIEVLKIWQEFMESIPKSNPFPSWPIWSMEFGATYPYESTTPYYSSNNKLGRSRGVFGKSLKGLTREQKFENLPSYARLNQTEFPNWKKRFIKNNREFYLKYKNELDPVVKKLEKLEVPSHQKFEWNVSGGDRNIYNYIIQFRGSGVRIKKTDYFPSLVTVRTQTPIIGWERRYISPREGAKIQSLNEIELPLNLGTAYNALGNAVNADLVYLIFNELFRFVKDDK